MVDRQDRERSGGVRRDGHGAGRGARLLSATALEGAGARLDLWTRWVAVIGFSGLVGIALLTMADAFARWLGLPRIPGFSDIGEVVFAVVIATCFPAGLLQGHNVTIRFLGHALGSRASAWLEAFGALVTLAFFALLVWQFVLLTLDLQANARTTQTIELPVAPWWWLTTAIMACTLPVQLWVLLDRLDAALTGRTPRLHEQMTAEVAAEPGPR